MISRVGTKYSSHTMASAMNMYAMHSTWVGVGRASRVRVRVGAMNM